MRNVGIIALCGAAMVAGSAVQAQNDKRYEVNSTAFKVGLYSPSKGDARRGGGRTLFAFEGDYVIQYLPESNMTNVVSLGYIEKDRLRLVPITLNQLYHDNRRTSGYDIYYGYGIGLYSVRLGGLDISNGSKLLLGGTLTAGWNLNNRSFIEAKYHFISKYNRKDVGGFQLSFGRRY